MCNLWNWSTKVTLTIIAFIAVALFFSIGKELNLSFQRPGIYYWNPKVIKYCVMAVLIFTAGTTILIHALFTYKCIFGNIGRLLFTPCSIVFFVIFFVCLHDFSGLSHFIQLERISYFCFEKEDLSECADSKKAFERIPLYAKTKKNLMKALSDATKSFPRNRSVRELASLVEEKPVYRRNKP